MEVIVNIKEIGSRYGTVGWMREQLENGTIQLKESNNYFLPYWSNTRSSKIKTHGLVIYDSDHSALIAYRELDGTYECDIENALGDKPYSHWCLNLTKAAKEALREICERWIEKVEASEEVL